MAPTEREIKFHDVMADLLQRSSATVTRKKLASTIGVTDATVSHYVKGRIKPSFEALVGIAEFFNVTLDYLVFGERVQPPASRNADSVRVDMLRALAESNGYNGRVRDMISRLNRRLSDEVERVAQGLLEDRENFGPAGFLTDDEAMAVESCARQTKIMISTAPADIAVDESGAVSKGAFFETMASNIGGGQRYQFIFYGRRADFAPYAKVYRDLLSEADVPSELVYANLEFRVIDSELSAGIVIHELDTAMLERREPILWERYKDSGIVDGTLIYISMRHQDALGGIVLYDHYFASTARMFDRDWRAAAAL